MESHKFGKVGFFIVGASMSLSHKVRNRVFTGPDGREYLWKLGEMSCEARTSEHVVINTQTDWVLVAVRK